MLQFLDCGFCRQLKLEREAMDERGLTSQVYQTRDKCQETCSSARKEGCREANEVTINAGRTGS